MKSLLVLILLTSTACAEFLETNPRIFGGEPALIEEFPHLVAFILKDIGKIFCAGTMIAERWILSAAHCETKVQDFFIEYGATDLFISGPEARILTPIKYISHELFSPDELTYDIALVRTKEVPNWNGYMDFYAKLAVPGVAYHHRATSFVAGWGTWSFYNSTRPPLQKAELTLYDYRTCQNFYKGNIFGLKIHSHQVCAGTEDFSKSECNGDSGGPLFVHKVLVGIVSWSVKPCTVAKYPGVFTDVSYFIPWIRAKSDIEFELHSSLYRKPRPGMNHY